MASLAAIPMNIPTAISSACIVLCLLWLRYCSFFTWTCVIGVPAALYAIFAERTKATEVKDTVVLVTGASSGLGKAIALEVARRGCKTVVLVARTEAKLKEVASECKSVKTHKSFNAVVVPCDLTSSEAVKQMADKVTRDYGALDLLVNNAGAGEWKHAEETTPEDAISMMACPYQTAFACSSLFIPSMAKARTGHIMNVSSAACNLGFRGAVGYGSARWAVRGFTKHLYWDVKELGIGVTLLNAAEITGTDYFKDAPGKAGGSSKARIPSLFQFVDKLGINYSTEQVAAAGVTAVESGWSVVNVPWYLLHPTVVLNCCTPWLVELVCSLGSAGIRGKKKEE
eukprot:TRINITY_DN106724_c0_g1_i1.p1 TRINITY_DN106724_c0_g1~~TRINITY_DN106724_c0_g1_i1.p1  ORF type:complete len:342 (+),score=49.92 TRINITY_DN106724_c0_g1_i1:63-1088(+)